MPTYIYECSNCKCRMEIVQSIKDDPLKDCVQCRTKKTMQRVIQAVGLVFKGSGFYATDYKGKP